MSKKAIITTVSILIAVLAVVGVALAVAWRVDELNIGAEVESDVWNPAVADMQFEAIEDGAGNITAYKIIGYKGTAAELTVPAEINGKPVTTVGNAFTRLKIVTLTLPSTVTVIETGALSNCNLLIKLNVAPNSVKSIGSYALMGNKKLKNIWLPDTLKTIGASVLSQCEVLENVSFEGAEGSVQIGANTFVGNNVNGAFSVVYGVGRAKR